MPANVMIQFGVDTEPVEMALEMLYKLGLVDEKLANEFKATNAELTKRAQAMQQNATAAQGMTAAAQRTTQSVQQLSQGLNNVSKAVVSGFSAQKIQEFDNNIKKANQDIQTTGGYLVELQQQIKSLQAQRLQIVDGPRSAAQIKMLSLQINELKAEYNTAMGTVDDFGKRMRNTNATMVADFARVGAAVASAFSILPLLGFEKDSKQAEEIQKSLAGAFGLLALAEGIEAAQRIASSIANKVHTASLIENTEAAGTDAASLTVLQAVVGVYSGVVPIATAATVLWRAALNLLFGPIGAISLGIVALVEIIKTFGDSEELAAKKIDILTESIKRQNDADDENTKAIKRMMELDKKWLDQKMALAEADADEREKRAALTNASASDIEKIHISNLERLEALRKQYLQVEINDNQDAQTKISDLINKGLQQRADVEAKIVARKKATNDDITDVELIALGKQQEVVDKQLSSNEDYLQQLQDDYQTYTSSAELASAQYNSKITDEENKAYEMRLKNLRDFEKEKLEADEFAYQQELQTAKSNEDKATIDENERYLKVGALDEASKKAHENKLTQIKEQGLKDRVAVDERYAGSPNKTGEEAKKDIASSASTQSDDAVKDAQDQHDQLEAEEKKHYDTINTIIEDSLKKDELTTSEANDQKRKNILTYYGALEADAKGSNERLVDLENQKNHALNQLDEVDKQDKIKALDEGFDKTKQLGDSLYGFEKDYLEKEEQDLKESLDNKQLTKAQYDAKEKQLKRKAAQDDKLEALFNIGLQTAVAISKATEAGPIFGIPAVAWAAGIGAVELGVAASKPIPYAKGTKAVPGTDMGRDSVLAMLQPGEGVMPVDKMKKHRTLFNAIYDDNFSSEFLAHYIPPQPDFGKLAKSVKADPLIIDYKQLAKVMAGEMDKRPVHETSVTEKGIRHIITKGNTITEYVNQNFKR